MPEGSATRQWLSDGRLPKKSIFTETCMSC